MLKEFLCMIIVLAIILEKLSLNAKYNKILFNCKMSDRNVEVGEIFSIESSVSNKKAFLASSIDVTEELPREITILDKNQDIETTNSNVLFKSTFYLGRNERITFRLRTQLSKRGLYKIGSCVLSNSDFLGFKKVSCTKSDYSSIIVYPERIKCDKLIVALNNFYGDYITRRQLINDPSLVMGYREYSGYEPLKSISWNQTAKYNEVMVKEYDYTQEQNVNVVLDVSYKYDFGESHSNLEACFSISRQICELLENKQIPYTFITNSYIEGIDEKVYCVNSTNNTGKAIAGVLDILGRSTYKQSCTFKDYVEYINTCLIGANSNCSIIYICTNHDEQYNIIEKMKITKNISLYTFFANEYIEGDEENVC